MSGLLTRTRLRGEVAVSSVRCDIDLANAAIVQSELRSAITGSLRALAVDLSEVRYVDSAGVRALFELARELTLTRQLLGVVVPSTSPLRRLLKITRLDEAVIVSDSEDECVERLRTASATGA